MTKKANYARQITATTGQGTVTLGAAPAGWFTFAEAGVSDGDTVRYRIDEGNNVEFGTGTYTATGTTLSRDTVIQSKVGGVAGTSKISLLGNGVVTLAAMAEDFAELVAGITSALNRANHTGTQTLATISNALLANLGDVNLTDISTDELLQWNGSAFVNKTINEIFVESGTSQMTCAFETPGNSSFVYGSRTLTYRKFGPLVAYRLDLVVTPTIGTASGKLEVSSLPYTPAFQMVGNMTNPSSSIDWPTRTQMHCRVQTSGKMDFMFFGDSVWGTALDTGDMTNGSSHYLICTGVYWTDS